MFWNQPWKINNKNIPKAFSFNQNNYTKNLESKMQNNYEEKVSMIHIKFKIWVRKKRKIYAYINRVKSHYDQRKNTSHDFTLSQINKLVIVHLEEGPNVKSLLMKLPKICLLPQVLQQQLLHCNVVSANIKWGFFKQGLLLSSIHNVGIATTCQTPNTNIETIRFSFFANESDMNWRFDDSYNKKNGRGSIEMNRE